MVYLRNMEVPMHISGWSCQRTAGISAISTKTQPYHLADDDTVLEGRFFALYKDDGSGVMAEKLADTGGHNITPTVLPKPYRDWILGDTYEIEGAQHLLLFHRPTGLFVPWRN